VQSGQRERDQTLLRKRMTGIPLRWGLRQMEAKRFRESIILIAERQRQGEGNRAAVRQSGERTATD
jgi:hypothetical protein